MPNNSRKMPLYLKTQLVFYILVIIFGFNQNIYSPAKVIVANNDILANFCTENPGNAPFSLPTSIEGSESSFADETHLSYNHSDPKSDVEETPDSSLNDTQTSRRLTSGRISPSFGKALKENLVKKEPKDHDIFIDSFSNCIQWDNYGNVVLTLRHGTYEEIEPLISTCLDEYNRRQCKNNIQIKLDHLHTEHRKTIFEKIEENLDPKYIIKYKAKKGSFYELDYREIILDPREGIPAESNPEADCVVAFVQIRNLAPDKTSRNFYLIKKIGYNYKLLPGGFVKKGSTPTDTLIEELNEELGIDLKKHSEILGVDQKELKKPFLILKRGGNASGHCFVFVINLLLNSSLYNNDDCIIDLTGDCRNDNSEVEAVYLHPLGNLNDYLSEFELALGLERSPQKKTFGYEALNVVKQIVSRLSLH